MKRSPPASERGRYAAEIRKPGPVKRLSREEIAKLEHQRNFASWSGGALCADSQCHRRRGLGGTNAPHLYRICQAERDAALRG